MLMLFLVLGLNLVISFLNARNVGRIWAESKAVGGWVRLLAWCGAIQSAAGFTFVYAVVVGYIAVSTGYLPAAMLGVMMNLIYIMLIVPLIIEKIYRHQVLAHWLGHLHHDPVVDRLRARQVALEPWRGRLEHVRAGLQHLQRDPELRPGARQRAAGARRPVLG